mgnify:CR=1 FL=1
MEEKEQITIGQLSLRQISLVKSVLSKKGFLFENVKEDSSKEGLIAQIASDLCNLMNVQTISIV